MSVPVLLEWNNSGIMGKCKLAFFIFTLLLLPPPSPPSNFVILSLFPLSGMLFYGMKLSCYSIKLLQP